MFRPLRSHEKTNGQLLRAELSESLGHARKAAGYAAGGVRATVGPRLAPVAQRVRSAAANGAHKQAKEKKVSSRRWPKLAGLAAVGALAGAVGAFVLRRRREQQWEADEPLELKEEREAATQPAAPTTGPE